MIDADASREALDRFIHDQRDALLADESFMNIYIAGSDWHIVPDFDAPPDFHASERVWYIGAADHPGKVYVTEPYKDINTGNMCFTISTMLSDGETVVAMDLNFSKVQQSIRDMTADEEKTAMIVTESGLIVGYSDMTLVGESAAEKLPEHAEVLRRVMASQAHGSFRVTLDGRSRVVFSSETSNHWFLILSVPTDTLYAESHRQIAAIASVNLLMLVVVVIFYRLSTRNRLRAALVVEKNKRFIDTFSDKLRVLTGRVQRLGDARLLREGDDPEILAGHIRETGDQFSTLANEVHSYAGVLQESLEEVKKKTFSLREFLEQINVIVGGQCEDKGLRYDCSVKGTHGDWFEGDDLKLKQVLINILGNSVKFTEPPGSVLFTVEQTDARDGKCSLRFTIADTGIGMDKAFIAKLFDAFSQEDATTTNKYGGSGLGMAITKRMVDMMGGEIVVESEKGVGSTFTVTIPLGRAVVEEAPKAADETAPDAGASVAGLHVLIAEDQEMNAEVLADLLKMEEMSSEWARDGQIAVEMFSKSEMNHFDAVLMDMRMPVMDGLTATREIRKLDRADAKTVPIVALTANAFEEDVQQCLQAGMNAHLSKPVDIDVLKSTLAKLIAK